jgi:hypothetical protein
LTGSFSIATMIDNANDKATSDTVGVTENSEDVKNNDENNNSDYNDSNVRIPR